MGIALDRPDAIARQLPPAHGQQGSGALLFLSGGVCSQILRAHTGFKAGVQRYLLRLHQGIVQPQQIPSVLVFQAGELHRTRKAQQQTAGAFRRALAGKHRRAQRQRVDR